MTKVCDIQVAYDKESKSYQCYYRLSGCLPSEFANIVEYKSWMHKSWTEGTTRKYFVFIYVNRENLKIVKSSVGFAPVLIRYLQGLGYLINGKENFRSREIRLGNMRYGLYDHQKKAVDNWLNSGCCGVIKMPTGTGKTITICEIIQKMGVKTIICMHRSDLVIQWIKVLSDQFGDDIKNRIGIISGKMNKKIRRNIGLIDDTSYNVNIKQDIVIATVQSLVKKSDLLSKESFGLLVWDEVHLVGAEKFSKVAGSIKSPYRIGASATVVRPDGTSPLIWGLMGDVCYNVSIKELINKKVIVNPVFNTIIINDEIIQSEIASTKLSNFELSTYVKRKSASSVIKMKHIINTIEELWKANKKFVLYTDFVNSKDGEVFVRDYYVQELNKRGIQVIGISSNMSGNERNKVFSMLENGKLDGLVFGLLGSEGIDIPKISSVVMCNETKSTIRFTQRVGRSMRVAKGDSSKNKAYIYEFLLNTPLELRWSNENFWEYESEGYNKERIYIK